MFQKIFISSRVSLCPSSTSTSGFPCSARQDKINKLLQLQASLSRALTDNQALWGKNKELSLQLQHLRSSLKAQGPSNGDPTAQKRVLRHQRNRSQPNMEIENQLWAHPQRPLKVQNDRTNGLIKMERQQSSTCADNSIHHIISSSKNVIFSSNTFNIIPSGKDLQAKFHGKIRKRQRHGSTLCESTECFETVQEIWTSSTKGKQITHKKSYLRQ